MVVGSRPVAVAKIVTFGEILRALFSCNRHFLRFALLPYYQRIKAVVSKIILGAVSGYFEKNLLQANPTFLHYHISTVFLFFVYVSTFLILLNLFHANNPFPYVTKITGFLALSGDI